jgi:hypothetical protein
MSKRSCPGGKTLTTLLLTLLFLALASISTAAATPRFDNVFVQPDSDRGMFTTTIPDPEVRNDQSRI